MASNEELVKFIQDGIDVQTNTEALWQQNTGIVHKLAASYAKDSYEEEDLAQEGYFALITAAEKYDPDCGAKFLTYFIIHLNARMRRYLAKVRPSTKMPINLVDKVTKYNKLKKQLQQELNAEPSDDLIRVLMHTSRKKMDEIKQAANMEAQSLDAIRDDDESGYNKIPDPHDRIEDLIDDVIFQQLSAQLWKMVDTLDPHEQKIIKEIFLHDRTAAEIGREEGVTRSRIDNIKHKALNKLKNYPGSKELKILAQDIYGIGLRGPTFAVFQRTWTSSTEYAALLLLEAEEKNG